MAPRSKTPTKRASVSSVAPNESMGVTSQDIALPFPSPIDQFFVSSSPTALPPLSHFLPLGLALPITLYLLGAVYTPPLLSSYSPHTLGALASTLLLLSFVSLYLPPTLFQRPHPLIWQALVGVGLVYTCFWTYILWLDLPTAQALFQWIDPAHSSGSTPLPQRSYGEDCTLTWATLLAQCDIFVVAHVVGWAGKAFMFRDFHLTMAVSFAFELMEYTFEYLQPNFAECWWDHWVMDYLVCNTTGVLFGHWVMSYCGMRQYNWLGVNDGGVRWKGGKSTVHHVLAQLTPPTSLPSQWAIFAGSPRRFLLTLVMVVGVVWVDLNGFFLKYALHLHVSSPLNAARLLLWCLFGMVGLRDYYATLSNPRDFPTLGAGGWVSVCAWAVEVAVVHKLGGVLPEWQGKVMPVGIAWAWRVVGGVAGLGALAWFSAAAAAAPPPPPPFPATATGSGTVTATATAATGGGKRGRGGGGDKKDD